MTKDTLFDDISSIVPRLLKMAADLCWNKIPDNCSFILSESDHAYADSTTRQQQRKIKNEAKQPVSLDVAIPVLTALYDDLNYIELYIYRASKSETIIEIQYFLKSSIDPDGRLLVASYPPMLSAKVVIPANSDDGKKKFDINWELDTYNHKWKMFWCRLRFRLTYNTLRRKRG